MTGPSKLKGSSGGGVSSMTFLGWRGGVSSMTFLGWRGSLDLWPFAYIRPSVPAILLFYYF